MTETEWVEAYYRSVRGYDAGSKVPYTDWIPRPYESHEHKQKVIDWISETGGFIKETDGHPHVVSAHFSMPFYGLELWNRRNVDVVHNNTYTECVEWWKGDGVRLFEETDGIADVIFFFGRYYDPHARKKPLMVGEWGGSPYGSRAEHLEAELHTGIWVMAMTRCAGSAGFWWWNFVDSAGLYPHFKGVAEFMKDEDRRGKDYQSLRAKVAFPEAEGTGDRRERQGVVLQNRTELLAYLHTKVANRRHNSEPAKRFDDPAFPRSGKGWLDVPVGLAPGHYSVEYWNTFEGKVVQCAEVDLAAAPQRIPIPDHRVDLALKVKRIEKAGSRPGSAGSVGR
jgi:hypothetical protein